MPSLFSRSRTFSTPQKKAAASARSDGLDEFGRVSSPINSLRSGTVGATSSSFSTPTKKDKKKDKSALSSKRSGTLPNPSTFPSADNDHFLSAESPSNAFPDGSFLPLNLERPRNEVDEQDPAGLGLPAGKQQQHDYGYLCYERHVVLGLEQLERLVDVVSDELETRGGMTTPFIFTNTAMDISSSGIKRLIHAFIRTCAPTGSAQEQQEAEKKWREEARYVGPHELGMCLRWGMARVIRSVGGHDVRGLLSYDQYVDFRDSEAATNYPPTHFQTFLPSLPPTLQYIVVRLLSLLARLVANSTSSGHTPPTVSPLFGPLFFGLGPATLAFHHAYIHYLRAVHAFEHILLAFVRWQDAPRSTTASAASLGVPVRLKEWIKGYPAMLPFTAANSKAKPQPRKGARTVRVMSVRRNVRMYTPDLVKSASAWAQKNANSNLSNSFAQSKEWERIAPAMLKLSPRYSDSYKKKMNMPPNFHPDVHSAVYPSSGGIGGGSTAHAPPVSLSSTLSSIEGSETDYFATQGSRTDDRFKSLTDLKWGEFESMGFNSLGDEKKLQFDLTESARQERASKRQTLSWNDFSSAGFSRNDAPLSATLQFSTPVVNTVSAWPSQQVEIHRKLKKSQKGLPAFGWDTEPVIGNEEVIEEAFIDVFCDLIYGGGWMDLERGESVDRDCNWALVEYKSLNPARTTASGGTDPRTETTLILYEEFVPLEYRQQLALPSKSRRRLPSLFSTASKKQWKQAATLNGRPYVVGHVPRSPSFREVEFEGLLHGSGGTKVLSLSKRSDNARVQSTISNAPVEYSKLPLQQPPQANRLVLPPSSIVSRVATEPTPTPQLPPPPFITTTAASPESALPLPPRLEEMHDQLVSTPLSTKKSRFRLPGSPSVRRSMIVPPAEYSTVEFRTRMASYSDDEYTPEDANEPEDVKQKRRESRAADAWVDILVGTQTKRMGEQDAGDATEQRRKARLRKSDADMASLEVAKVLAAVGKERSLSPTGSFPDMDRVDRDYGGVEKHIYDLDVDEIETVPRRRQSTTEDESGSELHLAYESKTDEGDDDELMAPILNARQMAREQRRLGYFDLHPERRPGGGNSTKEEDPRELLARNSTSDEGGGDDEDEGLDSRIYGAPEPRRPLPAPPVPVTPPKPTLYEPQPSKPAPRILPDIKILTQNVEPLVPAKSPLAVAKSTSNGSATAIPVATTPEPPAKTPTTATSKTAALIEMYREKERGGISPLNVTTIPVAPLNVSRLPVRTASLQPQQQQQLPAVPVVIASPPSPVVPAVPVAPPPVPASKTSPPKPEGGGYPLPAVPVPVPVEDPGRISPARYVHGAPLHNVLEEEEEED